jgi:peptide-methionine (S)-S-oxide reductase
MLHSLKRQRPILAVQLACAILAASLSVPIIAAAANPLPTPATDNPKTAGTLQSAVFAGGCFWGVQGVFEHVRGVRRAIAGYSGGEKSTAQYETVSNGSSGHAESVQITFDPQQVSFGELLQIFFAVAHDPTELNRQGPDIGTQYRSSIFYVDDAQRRIAQAYVVQLDKAKIFAHPIATRIDPFKAFYPAEAYHQDFLIKNPNHPYIVINDLPKIRNLQATFPALYQGNPVEVGTLAQ